MSITPVASARAGNASKTASTNREESMRHFLATTSALALAVLVGGQAVAQQPPAQPITRTVVAATKLPTVTDRPLLFRALSVTIPPGREEQRLNRQWHSLPDVGIDRSYNRWRSKNAEPR